jgi:hypothetical protein
MLTLSCSPTQRAIIHLWRLQSPLILCYRAAVARSSRFVIQALYFAPTQFMLVLCSCVVYYVTMSVAWTVESGSWYSLSLYPIFGWCFMFSLLKIFKYNIYISAWVAVAQSVKQLTGLGDRGVGVRVPVGSRNLTSSYRTDSGSGVHPTS